jgi:pimeloyl-ACP methyl ester carboxylesterase
VTRTAGPVALHVERRGAGEPLLWITGFTISAAIFDPVLPLFERRFDCVTYDNRGAGRSSAPRRPTSIPELAGDAVRVLDTVGLDSAHVLGASMGGMIAQELALRFPHRVRGLILVATTHGGPRAARPALRELGASTARSGLAGALFSPQFRRANPQRVRELTRLFGAHRAPLHGMAGHWWATVYHDTYSRLGRIAAPTLVLHGEEDVMDPLANSRALAGRIPGAELKVIPGGHAFMLERPQESYAAITEWLDRRGPIAPGPPLSPRDARREALSRTFGLPVGALRTGRSLVGVLADRRRSRDPQADAASGPADDADAASGTDAAAHASRASVRATSV